jgi:hypothetical protein
MCTHPSDDREARRSGTDHIPIGLSPPFCNEIGNGRDAEAVASFAKQFHELVSSLFVEFRR